MTGDFIGVVEAAYRLDGDDREWMQSVAEAATPLLGREYGVSGFSFDFSEAGKPKIGPFVTTGPAWTLEATMRFMSLAPESGAEHSLLGTPGRCTFIERLRPEEHEVFHSLFAPLTAEYGISPLDGGIIAVEPTGFGAAMFGMTRSPSAPTAREKARWARATVHLATALRLRRTLRRAAADEEEAILSPDGRCEHAGPAAQDRSSRETLRDAVCAIDRARGRTRRRDQDEALAIWKGLCSGRWSLVDRFESDGRRYVVAFRNDPRLPDPRALTEREKQIAMYAALGHSNKLIAYALGLSTSSVGWYLSQARRKLGARSRAELVRLSLALAKGTGGAP